MLYRVQNLPPEYLKVIGLIDGLRKRLQYSLSDDRNRWTGLLHRVMMARAIQGSNSIEGYNVTYEDAVAIVDDEIPLDAHEADRLALEGYRRAMTHILQLAKDERYELDLGTIRALHSMMVEHDLSAHPGRWRLNPVFVLHEPDHETVYTGVDAIEVPGLMSEFVAGANNDESIPVFIRAALAHLNLVMVHPFADGNGRMGRAIQTLILAQDRIVDPVFSSIEEYLGDHRLNYYEVLAQTGKGAWHPGNDPLPFIKFCLCAHYHQAEDVLRRGQQMSIVWQRIQVEIIEKRGLKPRMMFGLADAAFGIRVTNSLYRRYEDLSDQVALQDLTKLVNEGLLEPHGERRARYYVGGYALRNMWEESHQKRKETDPFEIVASGEQTELAV